MTAKIAANEASATVKVARLTISRSNSGSISRGTGDSNPRSSSGGSIINNISHGCTIISGISRGPSTSSLHSTQGDRVHHAFISGVVSPDLSCPSAAQHPLRHRTRVFPTRTQARKLPPIRILKDLPVLEADFLHHHSQPPRRRICMNYLFRLSPPGAPPPTGPTWRNFRHLHSTFEVQLDIHEGGVWIADSGASCHMTYDGTGRYDLRPSASGREITTKGGRRKLKEECVEKIYQYIFFTGKRMRGLR